MPPGLPGDPEDLVAYVRQRGCVQRIVIGPENDDDIPAVSQGDAQRAEAGPAEPPPGRIVEAGGRGVEGAAAHLVEVDAEGGQQVAVVPSWRLGPELGADRGGGGAEVHWAGEGLAFGERQEEVAVAQPGRAALAGQQPGPDDGLAGGRRERGEHRHPSRRACFLCTDWRRTPSAEAIACQVQPWARALLTCRASSSSVSLRKAATAARPVAGSPLSTATASSVIEVMLSA